MTTPNNSNDRGEVRRANPDNAATDPNAAAKQDQVKRDHDALEASARRVDASVPGQQAATDPDAAAKQDQIKRDHDALEASARRVDASVPTATDRNVAAKQDQVKRDHDALEASARRVEASVPPDVRDTPVQRADFTDDATERKPR